MADHTGKRGSKRAVKRIDTSSIKTTTLLSFVIFALFLVMILWGLSNFYLNSFYERARSQEVMRTAETLESQFRQDRYNFGPLALQTAASNDLYIRIDTAEDNFIFDGTREVQGSDAFENDVNRIKEKLASSASGNVSETRRDNSGMGSRLVYASYITASGVDNILCIIAPLYPDQVTIRILRDMLIYVSFIVLIVSLQALNKASYEMEKTDFYQREIIANVSHDLKTPLTMIRSYAEKIIDITGDNPEKRNADLNVIISETEHLNRLVTDMLSVSNLQSNNIELRMETFDLVEAARSVYESFLALATSEGFEIHFHPCKPAYVVGDRTRMTQVMTNFVSNAVKYSGDNKYIEIRLSKTSKKVTFHCIDHGMGIPSDEIGHVWDKYYRTSANHERGIEGTGLGLAIVKGILNLHGAKYGVESEEGKGSDFWFEMETVRKPSAEDTEKKDG